MLRRLWIPLVTMVVVVHIRSILFLKEEILLDFIVNLPYTVVNIVPLPISCLKRGARHMLIIVTINHSKHLLAIAASYLEAFNFLALFRLV